MRGPDPGRCLSVLGRPAGLHRREGAPPTGLGAAGCFCGRSDPGVMLFSAVEWASVHLDDFHTWNWWAEAERRPAPYGTAFVGGPTPGRCLSVLGRPAGLHRREGAPPTGLGAAGCFCGRPALGATLFSAVGWASVHLDDFHNWNWWAEAERRPAHPTERLLWEARPRGDACQSWAGLPTCIAARARLPRGSVLLAAFVGGPPSGRCFSVQGGLQPTSMTSMPGGQATRPPRSTRLHFTLSAPHRPGLSSSRSSQGMPMLCVSSIQWVPMAARHRSCPSSAARNTGSTPPATSRSTR